MLALHDTTTFKFGGEKRRTGLGCLHKATPGFLGHVTLAVTDGRVPLGVVALEAVTRSDKSKRSSTVAP